MSTASSRQQKIITVSGLYSGIGKTLLCERIVRWLPGIAAIKVTINDHVTEVLGHEAAIMEPGKDTWRLKTSGAGQVLWVRAQEEHLGEALADALQRLAASPCVLIEGNSVLGYITPELSFFLFDGRICDDKPLKPSRERALRKADIIIHNVRPGAAADEAAAAERARQINPTAAIVAVDVHDEAAAAALIGKLLRETGFLPSC